MQPARYAGALAHPMAWQAIYWLEGLLRASPGDESSFSKEYGSPEAAELTGVPGLSTLKAETLYVQAQYTTTGREDRVLVTCKPNGEDATGQAPSPMAESIDLLLRCMGMPPRRPYFEAAGALACLSTGYQLGREILADMTEQGRAPDWLVASKVLIELEDLSTVHHQACVDALNNPHEESDGAPGVCESLTLLESNIQSRVDALCAEHKLSPMTLSFNRDARGATVRVIGRQAVDEWHDKLAYRGKEYVVVDNYLRKNSLGLSPTAQAIDIRHKQGLSKLASGALAEVTTDAQDLLPSTPARTRAKKDQPSPLATAPVEIATQRCPAEVLAILRNGSWTASGLFKLPEGQLERKLYEQVRDYIALAEGKWISNAGGFRFSNGGEDRMRAGILSGEMVDPKDNGFFPTPSELAAELVACLGLRPGMKVLEPSAGRGALAIQAAKIVGIANVTCYELLPQNAQRLREMGFKVIEGDFLQVQPAPEFDAVVMNPPFARMSDIRHVVHATQFVRTGNDDGLDGPQVAAIMSPSFKHLQSKLAETFRRQIEEFAGPNSGGKVIRDIDAGAFKESGTNVRTTMVTLDVRRLAWNAHLVEHLPHDGPETDPADDHLTESWSRDRAAA